MIKRTTLISFVLVGILFSQRAGNCLAATSSQLEQAKVNIQSLIKAGKDNEAQVAIDKMKADFAAEPNTPETLCWIAEEYRWAGKDETAKSMYQQIMQQYPTGSVANKARLGVSRIDVLSLIKAGKTKEALDATDKLVADFAGHPDLPETLYWTAKHFEWTSVNYDETKRIYQQLMQNCAGSEFAKQAQVDFKRISHRTKIFSLIKTGDDAGIQAAIAELKADFAGSPELPSELYWIAREHEEYPNPTKYAQADAMYKQILQQYPGSDSAGNAKLDVLRMKVLPLMEAGKDADAQAVVDSMMTNYRNHPYLLCAMRLTGEQVYNKGLQLDMEGSEDKAKDYYRKAVKIFGIVTNELASPDDNPRADTPYACCMASHCYQKLGQYQKSVECAQRVIDSYHRFHLFWNALYLQGRGYEKLKSAGLMSSSEADGKIRAVYHRIVVEYPDCDAAPEARLWLSR